MRIRIYQVEKDGTLTVQDCVGVINVVMIEDCPVDTKGVTHEVKG